MTYRYASIVVDSLPFPSKPDKTNGAWMLDRLRRGMAFLTLQKHAFRLSSLWERVAWPGTIEDAEQAMEREVTGISSPAPSDITDIQEILFWMGNDDMSLHDPVGESEGSASPPTSAINHWLSTCEK
jgi:hypothetical protein